MFQQTTNHPMNPPFRRRLLPTLTELICRYWATPQVIEDPRIGAAIAASQAIVSGVSK